MASSDSKHCNRISSLLYFFIGAVASAIRIKDYGQKFSYTVYTKLNKQNKCYSYNIYSTFINHINWK